MTGDKIPGLQFKELNCQGTKQAKVVTREGSKAIQELRKLAFDFPKQFPHKVDKPESSGRRSIGKCRGKEDPSRKDPIHWCKENVDFRVRRVLMRCRTLKQERKKDSFNTKSKVGAKANIPIGKFGRGDLPHEFWEEERRLRGKKRKERLAKEEKQSGAKCPREEGLPSSGSPVAGQDWKDLGSDKVENLSKINPMILSLFDDLLSDTIAKQSTESMSKMTDGSLSKEEEDDVSHSEEKDGLLNTDRPGTESDLKDMGSIEVIIVSHVNLLIETLIDDIIGGVISKQGKESVPLMTDSSSSEEEEEEDISASGDNLVSPCSDSHGTGVYFKDSGVNKVTHIYNEAVKEIPCLTSDSDVGEEERMPAAPSSDNERVEEEVQKSILEDMKNRLSKYFKDRESDQVFTYNKYQKLSNLKSAIKSDFMLVAEDSDSQYGDDENEEEEEEEKEEQRQKTLPRGRGGASHWEELAEEERLRMVATMRKKMVAIAVKAHSQGIHILFDQYFYRLLIMRTLKCELPNQIMQQETVSLSPRLINSSSNTVAATSQALSS